MEAFHPNIWFEMEFSNFISQRSLKQFRSTYTSKDAYFDSQRSQLLEILNYPNGHSLSQHKIRFLLHKVPGTIQNDVDGF